MFSRREPVSAVMLERATRSLYHRGPDAQKQWISQDQRVGLGHARLSIIDLATGDQPIASEDGRTRSNSMTGDWPYFYAWNRMGRKGQLCRVLVRAKAMNSCLIEFADGYQAVTSRNALRRAK
jgi:hypothetical protein